MVGDYLEHFGQEVYAGLSEEILTAAGFRLLEERLATPAAAESDGGATAPGTSP